jgi:hypothetical protein
MEVNYLTYLTRAEVYARLKKRIASVTVHAKQEGDGVLADKMRKIHLDVMRLQDNDKTPKYQEII